MYSVSDAYKAAILSDTQRHKIKINWNVPGLVVPITLGDSAIVQGSFEITSQCSDQKDLKPGGVFISQLKISLDTKIHSTLYSFDTVGSVLIPTFSLLVDEDSDTWEDVPLGVFTVSEGKWIERGVNLVAYDNMSKLDKPCALDATVGIPWQIMSLICSQSGVNFGTSAIEMQDFPNANEVLGLYPDNDITTYRDALSYICQAAGCFAYADREGNIAVKRFGQSPVVTIDTTNRFTGASFSDYKTAYSRIRDNDVTYGTGNGTLIDFGANPFLVYGNVDSCHQALVSEVSTWIYTPFDASMIGDPAIDLGDVIYFTGGIARSGQNCLVNKIVFKYKKGVYYSGFGANPMIAQANQNRSDKAAKGASNAAKAQEIKYLSYINAGDINIEPDNEVTVCFLDFSLTKTSMVEFWLQAQLENREFQLLTARVYLNDELITELQQVYLSEMRAVFTIMAFTEAPDSIPLILRVTFESGAGAITIPAEGLRALLKGQGISTETPWDGKIRIEEALEFIETDELVEVTPDAIRLRKKYLSELDRRMHMREVKKSAENKQ